jgi:hypothetical protein
MLGIWSFVLLLSAAATNDILSRLTGVSIENVLWFFRITCVLVPPLLGLAINRYAKRRLARHNRTVAGSEQEAQVAAASTEVLAGSKPKQPASG